jgi:hypothetical protein
VLTHPLTTEDIVKGGARARNRALQTFSA